MARSESTEAIVLNAHDIGEADRFCILLTRNHGRIAAKASGVRRPLSRMGGRLLPFQHIKVGIAKSAAGYIITGSQSVGNLPLSPTLESFSCLSQGIELILRLLDDEQKDPDIFECVVQFIQEEKTPALLTAFSFRILFLLGLLPGEDVKEVEHLRYEEKQFLSHCAKEENLLKLSICIPSPHSLNSFLDHCLSEHLSRPLRAPLVTEKIC